MSIKSAMMDLLAPLQTTISTQDALLRRLNTTDGDETDTASNEGQILKDTLRVYGSLFAILFSIFCCLRWKYPRLYNIRSWAPNMGCELAQDRRGFLRWVWELYWVNDDVVLEQCGMDALCFLRVLDFGFKLSLMGMFCGTWLMPIYATSSHNASSSLNRISTSYLPPGSNRFIATVIAAYIIFFFAFWLILKEFEWYTDYRHKFLMQTKPRNYAVYVTGIPEEYQSSFALKEYFRQCFSKEGVLEAHVTMELPNLDRKVSQRKAVVKSLEHANNLQRIKGITEVCQSVKLSTGKIEKWDAIDVYQEELETLNAEISDSIRRIKFLTERMQDTFERSQATRSGLSIETGDDGEEQKWGANFTNHHLLFPLNAPANEDSLNPRRRRLSTIDSAPCSPFSDGSSSSYSSDDHSSLSIMDDDIESSQDDGYVEDNKTPSRALDCDAHAGAFSGTQLIQDSTEQPSPLNGHVDQAAVFESVFFGTSVLSSPKVAQKDVEEANASAIVEDPIIDASKLPVAESNSVVGEDATVLIDTTISLGPPCNDEPLKCPTNPISSISEGDCANGVIEAESPIDEENPEEGPSSVSSMSTDQSQLVERPPPPEHSPLVRHISKRKSLEVITKLPIDMTRIATKAVAEGSSQMTKVVKEGSIQMTRAVKEGSGQMKRVVHDGSQHVKKTVQEVNPENLKKAAEFGRQSVIKAKDVGVSQLKKAKNVGVYNAKSLASFVLGNGDGTPRPAGFVAFTKLSTTNAALQMCHHSRPFCMDVEEAPEPDDIYWRNVGMPHKARQIGRLTSIGLTVLLCFFWTIPVSFIASLTEVDALRESVEFIDQMLTKAPWMQPILEQLAPLLLLCLNAFLPVILREFSKLEGHIGSSLLEASLFTKIAGFMLIQTFFVSAISGGIWAELSNMLTNPSAIIDLLARSLPAQSSYFMQIMLVDTFIGLSTELLRVIPLSMAVMRRCIGPNLTEKERNTVYMGLRPLADPWEFEHAQVFGEAILYFMVFFVYSTMAPITSFFLAFCYPLLQTGYRNQFFYNHKPFPDSGGKLFSHFIGIALACMLIAQITLVGLLALKKAAIATTLMFPLLAITILFNVYIGMRHFYVTEHLPTRDCLQLDRKHFANGGLDFDFLKNKYLQPSLLQREIHPSLNGGGQTSRGNSSIGESSRSTKCRMTTRSVRITV